MHCNLLTFAGSSLAASLLSSALVLGQERLRLWPDRAEIEHFLEEADITHREKIGTGITNPEKVTLELDGVVRYAAFKKVDKDHDSWKSEVAAYELDKLLGLGMVPPTVKRGIRGRNGSLQLWVEGVSMNKFDGTMRDVGTWRDQVSVMWLFDDLIANIDRHLNNAIVSPDERLILIDNSKTFRYQKTLLNDLNGAGTGTHARFWCVEYDADRERYPTRYPPELVERLRTVTQDEIKDAIGKYVWGQNRDQVFDRLELILERIDGMGGAEASNRGTGRYHFPPGLSDR
ncbi:MAG TPA: hypothetical protein VLK65_14130 [Vicinamibacteria bacterium]|nr:hypothetical protein [Vicinamibacteria bacterium]